MAKSYDKPVSREVLFNSIVKEAGDFYNLILGISSAFLGGSLFFIEKIAPNPQGYSLVLLYAGYVLLILTIALSAYVRWKNLESGKKALESKYDEANAIDCQKEKCCKFMLWFFVLGITLVSLFGMVSLTAAAKEKTMAKTEKPANQVNEHIEGSMPVHRHSIPYGSTGGGKPKPSGSGGQATGSNGSSPSNKK